MPLRLTASFFCHEFTMKSGSPCRILAETRCNPLSARGKWITTRNKVLLPAGKHDPAFCKALVRRGKYIATRNNERAGLRKLIVARCKGITAPGKRIPLRDNPLSARGTCIAKCCNALNGRGKYAATFRSLVPDPGTYLPQANGRDDDLSIGIFFTRMIHFGVLP